MDLLVTLERLLAATGNAVALCPHYGSDVPIVAVEETTQESAR